MTQTGLQAWEGPVPADAAWDSGPGAWQGFSTPGDWGGFLEEPGMSSGDWAPAPSPATVPHVCMALPRYSLQSAFTDIITSLLNAP